MNLNDFLSAIDADTIILTPNRRLSAYLHKHYQQQQLHAEKNFWATPIILPITTWVQKCWQDYTSTTFTSQPFLLNDFQEQFIWETILASNDEHFLLQMREAAELIKSAWAELKAWQVALNHPLLNNMTDDNAFLAYAKAFAEYKITHHCIEQASLPDDLCEKIAAKKIKPPLKIMLYGFTELSPQFKHLFSTCEEAGTEIYQQSASIPTAEPQRIELHDHDDELWTMANWAKTIWQKNKAATIACVIPNLDKIRDRVRQMFCQVFLQENLFTDNNNELPFNLSAGKSLTHYPIIYAALQSLNLHKKTISSSQFRYLLATPFIGDAEAERKARAKYDRLLRRKNVNAIQLKHFLNESHPLSITKYLPAFAKRLNAFLNYTMNVASENNYYDWASIFNEALTSLGWPGERSLASEEFQTVDQWLTLLTQFIGLDEVAPHANYHDALQNLYAIASKRSFQAKTPDANIQILGTLEAAGMPFDYIWIAGMDDLSWPPQPRPNPFLPKRLQRELNMPHATAERELQYCTDLIAQFKANAKAIVFSNANKNADIELQASPLIKHYREITKDQLELITEPSINELIWQSQQIESICDEQGPVVMPDEKIRGGVSVIKQQALCPFRAFAEWRLHAHELESLAPGFRAKDRGTMLHKVLELLWKEMNSHANLMAMTDADLEQLICATIDLVFKQFPHARDDQSQYLSLEKIRLQKLITDWLSIEKNRTPFTVLNNEQTMQITLNRLSLSLKIDRIDELADGKKLIIDYKTGKHNEIANWFSDRPEEPQLPIYFLIDPHNTVGITFAQIAPGEHGFKGVSRYDVAIKGIKLLEDIKHANPEWDGQLNDWQTILNNLSDDFYQGNARVDPKAHPQTCTWCKLSPLCRIEENDN